MKKEINISIGEDCFKAKIKDMFIRYQNKIDNYCDNLTFYDYKKNSISILFITFIKKDIDLKYDEVFYEFCGKANEVIYIDTKNNNYKKMVKKFKKNRSIINKRFNELKIKTTGGFCVIHDNLAYNHTITIDFKNPDTKN
jgi:hypothetical protein